NPVMRALQTIAAIESETRKLSASSLASSNSRNGRTAPSANSKATADLNRGSGAPPIAQVEATTPEAAFALDQEIRIDKRDRVAVAPARDVIRPTFTIITSVLSLALVLFLGWIGGSNLDFFNIKPSVAPRGESPSADPSHAAKSERLA